MYWHEFSDPRLGKSNRRNMHCPPIIVTARHNLIRCRFVTGDTSSRRNQTNSCHENHTPQPAAAGAFAGNGQIVHAPCFLVGQVCLSIHPQLGGRQRQRAGAAEGRKRPPPRRDRTAPRGDSHQGRPHGGHRTAPPAALSPRERMAILELKDRAELVAGADGEGVFRRSDDRLFLDEADRRRRCPTRWSNCRLRSTSSRTSCAHSVRRLKALCPSLGKVKIAQSLAHAGLHFGATTVGRMLNSSATAAMSPTPRPARRKGRGERIGTAKRPNHVWHVDLTAVPTAMGFCSRGFRCAAAEVAVLLLAGGRRRSLLARAMGVTAMKNQPTSTDVRALSGPRNRQGEHGAEAHHLRSRRAIRLRRISVMVLAEKESSRVTARLASTAASPSSSISFSLSSAYSRGCS